MCVSVLFSGKISTRNLNVVLSMSRYYLSASETVTKSKQAERRERQEEEETQRNHHHHHHHHQNHIQRRNSRFLQSHHCAANCLQHWWQKELVTFNQSARWRKCRFESSDRRT